MITLLSEVTTPTFFHCIEVFMKTLLLALTLVLTTATASAATNVKFVATDNSDVSNVCITAVKEGLRAAKKMSGSNFFNTKCNGQSVRAFADSHKVNTISDVSSKEYLVKPANSNAASKACAQAAKSGVKSVIGTVDFDLNTLKCNGQSIYRFAKKYSNI